MFARFESIHFPKIWSALKTPAVNAFLQKAPDLLDCCHHSGCKRESRHQNTYLHFANWIPDIKTRICVLQNGFPISKPVFAFCKTDYRHQNPYLHFANRDPDIKTHVCTLQTGFPILNPVFALCKLESWHQNTYLRFANRNPDIKTRICVLQNGF